jgi:hypothetical protein
MRGIAALVSDAREYAEIWTAVATSAHCGLHERERALGREPDRVHDAVEVGHVFAHPVGQRGEVVVVRDVELDDGRGHGQPLGHGRRELHLAAERGEHHLGTLLLRQAGDVEGDGGVEEDTGDEELLALEQHLGGPFAGGGWRAGLGQ